MDFQNRRKKVQFNYFTIAFYFVFLVVFEMSHIDASAMIATNDYEWLPQEEAWIKAHEGMTLKLGLDPFSGMDYYKADGKPTGYLLDVIKLIEKDLNLNIDVDDQSNWETVLEKLKTSDIDLLFGANATAERMNYMSFTKPIYQYPYSVYTVKSTGIRTIGDLDKKRVGFLAGDIIDKSFPKLYKNIHYTFPDQVEGLEAVRAGEIDVFITANGGITKKYAIDYPEIKIIADLTTFTSEMTISTQIENKVLSQIMDKIFVKRAIEIKSSISSAEKEYNRYILGLTDEEKWWIIAHPKIIVGAADDYLPFDYYQNGQYKGIAGDYLTKLISQIGLTIEVVHAPFDLLYQNALKGEVHVLNMAKTDDRLSDFVFTDSFSEERDEIFGNRQLPYLQDIYELEGKRIAVVKGYWHKDYLIKNLTKVTIVETKDLKESMQFVSEGKVDYLIENPTVANYYIEGLGYSNIIQKGNTSQDSFLFYGIAKNEAPLASILSKAMRLVEYEKIKSLALQEVPSQKNVMTTRLLYILLFLAIVLGLVVIYLITLIRELINHKTQLKISEEREKLIYLDGLTGFKNRLYFNSMEKAFYESKQSQIYLMADLNGLKLVNDTYGHMYGDHFLTAFSEALRSTFKGEIIIRMGGDEFLVVLMNWDEKHLEIELEALELACKKNSILLPTQEYFVPAAAVGWSIRTDLSDVNEAIIAADQMMYQHKANLKRRANDH